MAGVRPCYFSHTVSLQARHTRPIVLHKVEHVSQMDYLHWRARRCGIPFEDLTSTEALAAAADFPAQARDV